MASKDVIINYAGDSSSLDTASKKAQASVNGVTGAVDKTAVAQKKASTASKELGDSIGGVGQSAAKSVGLLREISPAAAQAAGGLNDLADVGEVASEAFATIGVTGGIAAVAIAALAITLGTAIGVWQAYNEESTIAATIAENVAAAEAERQPILDALAIKMVELKVATGELSEEEGILATETEKGAQRQIDALEGVEKKIAELTEATHGYSAAIGDFAANLPAADYNLVAIAVDGLTTSSEELETQLKAENAEKQKTIDANDKLTQASKDAAVAKLQEKEALEDIARAESEAAKRKAAAEKAAAALEKTTQELSKAMQEENDAADKAATSFNTLMQSLIDMEDADNERAQGAKSASEKVTDAYEDEQDAIEETRRQLLSLATTQAAVEAANIRADSASVANKKKWVAQQSELFNESRDAQVAAIEDANERIGDLHEKQDDIFEKGAQDRKDMILQDRLAGLEAVKGTIEIVDALVSMVADKQAAALDSTHAELDKLQGLLEDLDTTTVDAAGLSGDALVKAYTDGKVAVEELSDAQRQFLELQLKAQTGPLEDSLKAQQEAALETWKIQKKMAIAVAAITGAQAVLMGLATGGPVGGVLAGIAAAISIAEIMTSSPPSFREGYFGGPMGAGGGVQPDQQLAWIEPDSEVVMPSQGVQAAGGRDAARAQAAGIPPMAENTTVVRFGHREISRIVSSPSARKGILDASVRPRGRGNRYKKVQ